MSVVVVIWKSAVLILVTRWPALVNHVFRQRLATKLDLVARKMAELDLVARRTAELDLVAWRIEGVELAVKPMELRLRLVELKAVLRRGPAGLELKLRQRPAGLKLQLLKFVLEQRLAEMSLKVRQWPAELRTVLRLRPADPNPEPWRLTGHKLERWRSAGLNLVA